MAWLLFIFVPIGIYWHKLFKKYNAQEGTEGVKKFFLQLIILLLVLVLFWVFLFPELTVKKPFIYMHMKGLLLFIISVVLLITWPIIMEVRLDRRFKKV